MMGEKPDWVQVLGDAFLAQPEDVMDSVQRLRAQAQKAGNLSTNSQVKVTTETVTNEATGAPAQVIVVQPAQPEVVYVPTYNPTVVYGAWPYPAYPPYYIPPPPGYWFSAAVATGIAWGVGIGITNALWGNANWGRGDVNINVNRYNNINANNNRINGNGNSNWNHNTAHRGNTPYRGGDATRQNLDRKAQAGSREQYRGRDAERARATQSMQNRGIAADRSVTSGRTPGTAGGQAGDRGGQNMSRDRAQAADRDAMRNNSQSMNRDNALRGANNGNARAEMNRGQSSYQSAQRDTQRPQASGGAGARPGGGGAAQRPSGGGGGATSEREAAVAVAEGAGWRGGGWVAVAAAVAADVVVDAECIR